MDYNKTINLPKTEFPMRAGLPKREPEMLARWEKIDVYNELMKKNAGKAYTSNLVFKALKDKNSTESTFRLYFKIEAALKLPRRIINKLHRML